MDPSVVLCVEQYKKASDIKELERLAKKYKFELIRIRENEVE